MYIVSMNKIFELTNKYIIIATPLILFSLLSSIYLIFSAGSKGLLHIIAAVLILFLMGIAFVAGWGKMVKSAALEESADDPNGIIRAFPAGVGEYFLPVLGLFFCVIVLNLLFLSAAVAAGLHFIGDAGININDFSKAMTSQESLRTFLSSLSVAQLLKINLWNALIVGTMTVLSFILFLYLPALFFTDKNPFKALCTSVRCIFCKKFFKTLGIYFLIFVVNFFISILSALFSGNVIMNFIMTLTNFYFICCVAVGVFYYYYHNFVNPKLGQYVDTMV